MRSKTIAPVLVAALLVTMTASLSNLTKAAAGLRDHLPSQTGCSSRCPACDHVCKLDAEEVEVEKSCFDVEQKVICIPRVVFPWQKRPSCGSCSACDGSGCSSCVHNGARVRKVCVLTTKKYKCPACEYSWSAEKRPCATGCATDCGAGCAGGCAAGCDAGCDSAVGPIVPMPTISAASESSFYRDAEGSGLEAVVVEATRAAALPTAGR